MQQSTLKSAEVNLYTKPNGDVQVGLQISHPKYCIKGALDNPAGGEIQFLMK